MDLKGQRTMLLDRRGGVRGFSGALSHQEIQGFSFKRRCQRFSVPSNKPFHYPTASLIYLINSLINLFDKISKCT